MQRPHWWCGAKLDLPHHPRRPQVGDAPRLLARLQAQQGQPEAAAFRQLHASIGQLLALRRLVATLAPGAAAAAAEAAQGGAAAGELDGAISGEADDGDGVSMGDGLFSGLGAGGWDASGWGGGLLVQSAGGGGGVRGSQQRGRSVGRAGGGTAWDQLPITRKVLEGITPQLEACE